MIDWLATSVGIDVRTQQHDTDAEIGSLSAFYTPPSG
jgi:hypothetical protein